MAATFSIISKAVGEGGQTKGVEAKRIQQLLWLAGFTSIGKPDGVWGKNSQSALMEFFESLGERPKKACIEPAAAGKDPLLALARKAGVLIALPNGNRSATATNTLFNSCAKMRIPYGWEHGGKPYGGGTRMIWGFTERPGWAVATTVAQPREFDTKTAVTLNCTGFANLMMSVWCRGNAHGEPYSSSQDVGGWNALGKRYSYQPLAPTPYKQKVPGMFENLDTLESVLEPNRIYHFGICRSDGFITHDTVLMNEEIYECNLDKTPAVYSTSLQDRWARLRKKNSYAVVYGPGPF